MNTAAQPATTGQLALATQPGTVRAVMSHDRMQLARELAKSRQIPPSLQNSPGDVYMVMEVCDHFGLLFPLAVWEVSVIKGRVMFGGKLCAAMLNNSGKLAERLTYEYSGEGDERTCKVSARLASEATPRSVEVVLKKVRTPNNENWIRDPDQQLAYSGSRKWGRLHLPEVLLGATFMGEDLIDITPANDGPSIEVRMPDTMAELRHEHATTHAANENQAVDTADTPTETAKPFPIRRIGDDWSAWATSLMAYIRAASDIDVINEWTLVNADELAALQRYDAGKHRRLIDMINHQIAIRREANDT